MANVYILTEEGRVYNEEGVRYILDQIRNTFHDTSDVNLKEGALYNSPDVLAKYLNEDPEHSYVFVSHNKGLEILYDINDIKRFLGLLEDRDNANETSWSIIMKALGLL